MAVVMFTGATLALHAPDGLFSLPVNVGFGLAVLLAVALASSVVNRAADPRRVPLMGILAAFVFAAQMVNFPVGAGTTGHLLGGVLAAVLLGPAAATLIMTTVILFQAFLGDGGLTALGPNIFNMGLIGTCGGYAIYRAVLGTAVPRPARMVAAAFFAGWVSVVLASVFVSVQLAASGTIELGRALPAMVYTHMVIGVGEASITASVLAFVLKTRPELVPGTLPATPALRRPILACGLGAALVIATVLSLLPALWDHPDGFEAVAAAQGVLPRAGTDPLIALLPDYTVPGLSGVLSTSAAGAIGTLVVFAISLGVGRVLMRPSRLWRCAGSAATTDSPSDHA